MLIKQKDPIEPDILELNRLLALPSLTKRQKEEIEDEIYFIRAGAKGEKDAAYHIDFELKGTENWAIIHDLRIEHKDRVAQIDHLLISLFLDIFVIESKNFTTSIRINDEGEFQVQSRHGWRGMRSPVEQNNRHADVLKNLIEELSLAPKWFGMTIEPNLHKWILVAPECNISGRNPSHDIMKMDMFGARIQKFRNQSVPVLEIVRRISPQTLVDFAQKLVCFHKPITFNYAAKFGISDSEPTAQDDDSKYQPRPVPLVLAIPKNEVSAKSRYCESCGEALESKAVTYCLLNKKRFEGKCLCRKCQGTFESTANCDQCGVSIDSKVVAFCRFNSKKFNKRSLCRTCQGAIA